MPWSSTAANQAPRATTIRVTSPRTEHHEGKEERIIQRAGLTPGPKLFHNLRATRQTEWAATKPAHVVCEWIGNSEKVAREHYLRVTDADFQRADSGDGSALRNPVQYATA